MIAGLNGKIRNASFLINCPPHRLEMIDRNAISDNIENKNEIVVICAMARYTEKKIIIISQLVNDELFDFSNQYYSAPD